MLRIPHCLDNRLTDGGKVVSPTHRPLLYSPEKLFLFLRSKAAASHMSSGEYSSLFDMGDLCSGFLHVKCKNHTSVFWLAIEETGRITRITAIGY
jgi:hypothetical protein